MDIGDGQPRASLRKLVVALVLGQLMFSAVKAMLFFNWAMFVKADFIYPVIWAPLVALVLLPFKLSVIEAIQWYRATQMTIWWLGLELAVLLPIGNLWYLYLDARRTIKQRARDAAAALADGNEAPQAPAAEAPAAEAPAAGAPAAEAPAAQVPAEPWWRQWHFLISSLRFGLGARLA